MAQTHIAIISLTYMVNAIIGQVLPTIQTPIVSDSCRLRGICEDVVNYPTMVAIELIKELKDNNTLIADDTVLATTQKPRETWRILGGPMPPEDSEEENGIQLCESTIQYEIPKAAENRNNEWKFIINSDRKPVQRFRAERCVSNKRNDSMCSRMMSFIPNYRSACVQRWTLKEMYYIDNNGKIEKDYFKVPTCCSCRLFHVYK